MEWLTTDEVAEMLRVSDMTVRNLTTRGEIQCAMIGNQRRFHKDHILAYTGCDTLSELDELWKLAELRTLLRINIQSLRAEIHEGRLRAIRVGQQWRVTNKEYEQWLQRASTWPAALPADQQPNNQKPQQPQPNQQQ